MTLLNNTINLLENLNTSKIDDIAQDTNISKNIFDEMIVYANEVTKNWLGIGIVISVAISLYMYVDKHKNEFGLITKAQMGLFIATLMVNLNFMLFLFKILRSLNLFVWTFSIWIILLIVNYLQKEQT